MYLRSRRKRHSETYPDEMRRAQADRDRRKDERRGTYPEEKKNWRSLPLVPICILTTCTPQTLSIPLRVNICLYLLRES